MRPPSELWKTPPPTPPGTAGGTPRGAAAPDEPPADAPPGNEPEVAGPEPAAGAKAVVTAERLFDEAVRWVAKDEGGSTPPRTFRLEMDARFVLDTQSYEGPTRLWLESPERYRTELTIEGRRTTKILAADQLFLQEGERPWVHVNRTPEGRGADWRPRLEY